jgi:hypothetical protein
VRHICHGVLRWAEGASGSYVDFHFGLGAVARLKKFTLSRPVYRQNEMSLGVPAALQPRRKLSAVTACSASFGGNHLMSGNSCIEGL